MTNQPKEQSLGFPKHEKKLSEKNHKGEALFKKIGQEIKNTLNAVRNIPPKEKKALFGGVLGILAIAAIMSPDKKDKKKKEKTSKELAGLKGSIESNTEEGEEFYEDSEYETEEFKDDWDVRLNEESYAEGIADQQIEDDAWTVGIMLNENEIINHLQSLSAAGSVIYGIRLATEKYRTGGRHCGDWVNRVFEGVGCTTRQIYRNLHYEGRDCGDIHASEKDMAQIIPGCHLYYNNKNKASKRGNHSAIFVRWLNYDKKIAQVASYSAKGNRIGIHKANFEKNPITFIGISVKKQPPNINSFSYQLKDEPANIKGKLPIDIA